MSENDFALSVFFSVFLSELYCHSLDLHQKQVSFFVTSFAEASSGGIKLLTLILEL